MSVNHPLSTFLEQPEEFLQSREKLYRPLDSSRSQIRLLYIAPGPFDDEEVNLSIEVVSLDDDSDYEAISYTWGTLHPVSQVRIQNIPYNVCGSQYAALRYFRLPDKIRIMWMDVICIDEVNVEERSQQVSMMNKIYSLSKRTQVWLGDVDPAWEEGIPDEEWTQFVDTAISKSGTSSILESQKTKRWAELAPAFLKVIQDTNSFTRGALHILDLIAEDIHLTEMPYFLKTDDKRIELLRPWYNSMRVLGCILNQPWWSRVWVLQEVALSRADPVLHIGNMEVPYSSFQRAAA